MPYESVCPCEEIRFPTVIIRKKEQKGSAAGSHPFQPDDRPPRLQRDILNNTPIDAIVMISEVFPALISGSGSPVGGTAPLTTSALSTTWIA